jgi:hypothetical protein
VLVQVKNKRERSLQVRPPGVEKTSRLRSRDPSDEDIPKTSKSALEGLVSLVIR